MRGSLSGSDHAHHPCGARGFVMDRAHQTHGRILESRAEEPAGLRVGLVGLGYWGPNLLRGLMELPGVEVAYVCDQDRERLATVSRRCPGAVATDCYEDLLADARV